MASSPPRERRNPTVCSPPSAAAARSILSKDLRRKDMPGFVPAIRRIIGTNSLHCGLWGRTQHMEAAPPTSAGQPWSDVVPLAN